MKEFILIFTAIFTPLCFAQSPSDDALVQCDANEKKCIAVDIEQAKNCSNTNPSNCYNLISYISLDSKKTWLQTEIEDQTSYKNIHQLACDSKLEKCNLVGFVPKILSTSDGGHHWRENSLDNRLGICHSSKLKFDELNSIDHDSNDLNWVAVGKCSVGTGKLPQSRGYAIVSNDGGINWHYSSGQYILDFYIYELKKVVCEKNSNICEARGWDLNLNKITLKSYDTGEHWQMQNS